MKFKRALLLLSVAMLVMGCNSNTKTQTNPSNPTDPPGPSTPEDPPEPPNDDPVKVVVNAHTLKDSNPPIDIDGDGERVDKDTWDSFKNGTQSFFNGHYNYTFQSYSGGVETIEAFTKNGYFMRSSAGRLYYERKSGNTFYQYISVSDGWRRQETTLDIVDKYTYRIVHELSVHIFDYSNYTYDEDFGGLYRYTTETFGSNIKFQNGYITYLYYAVASSFFTIKLAFDTEIEIPKSYYYK